MMKSIKILFLALSTLTPLAAQADSLELKIQVIKSAKGKVRIAVYDNESAYTEDGKPVAVAELKAQTPSIYFKTELPPGLYAVKLMHDIDDNKKLNVNLVGIPKEPYGFSNNTTGRFGPPKWKAASFKLEGNTNLTIDLKH